MLTGDTWVPWMDKILAEWEEQGIPRPEGLEETRTPKLTVDGVKQLRAFAKAGSAGASELLGVGLRAPSVSLKK